MIRGIQFVSDALGRPTGVLIDLKRHQQVWEDLYDAIIAASREGEPRVGWEDVKKRLKKTRPRRG